jgi:uncharacterized membrane protein (UPF0127 family)
MRGLLGRARLEPGSGLLLRPAFSIHTMFMRFPASVRGARAVLELAAGEAARRDLASGDQLTLAEVE